MTEGPKAKQTEAYTDQDWDAFLLMPPPPPSPQQQQPDEEPVAVTFPTVIMAAHPFIGVPRSAYFPLLMCRNCLEVTAQLDCVEFANQAIRFRVHMCKVCRSMTRQALRTGSQPCLFRQTFSERKATNNDGTPE